MTAALRVASRRRTWWNLGVDVDVGERSARGAAAEAVLAT